MTALIFIIASWLHAFFLVVTVRSFLQVLVEVAVNSYFQHPICEFSHHGSWPAWSSHIFVLPMQFHNPCDSLEFTSGLWHVGLSWWCLLSKSMARSQKLGSCWHGKLASSSTQQSDGTLLQGVLERIHVSKTRPFHWSPIKQGCRIQSASG